MNLRHWILCWLGNHYWVPAHGSTVRENKDGPWIGLWATRVRCSRCGEQLEHGWLIKALEG